MEILKEITEWDWPSHTYLLSDTGKLMAYVKASGGDPITLTSKMHFDKRGRKFIKVQNKALASLATPELNTGIVVKSDSGKTYYITESNNGVMRCSCPGYGFRNKCKHIDQIGKEKYEPQSKRRETPAVAVY